MKRSFSIALILALLGTIALPPTVVAEEAVVLCEEAEASVAEAIQLYDTGLDSTDPTPTDGETALEQTLADIDGESLTDDPTEASAIATNESTDISQDEESAAQNATDIQLSRSSVSIGLKEKYSGVAVIPLPNGAKTPEITWRSSKPKVVKVNEKTGVITGLKRGSAMIYAKINGTKKEVKCKVTVKKKPKKITVNPGSVALTEGGTHQLKASVPSGCASGKLTYKSSDPSVATVNESGFVTAISAGSASVTVSTYNGKKATCKVTVAPAPVSVVFESSELSVAVDETKSVKAIALAADGSQTSATFTYGVDEYSLDTGCVTVDPSTGSVRGVRAGQVVITATAQNGVVGRCVVTVDVGPKSVLLNSSSITIGVKEVYTDLIAELVVPDGASTCAQSLRWYSSNSKIAKIDALTGAVTGVKTGTCTIKAEAPNGKNALCTVKVISTPTSKKFFIYPAVGALEVSKSGQYRITEDKDGKKPYRTDPEDKNRNFYLSSLTYESSDPSVATIDSSGIVTAVAPGTTKITVTTYNGVKKTAELVVNGGSGGEGGNESKSGNSEKIEYLLKVAESKLNKPYRYGSFGPNAFDCSGFAYWCYKQINITLRDSAKRQGYDTRYPQVSYDKLQPGDLVFFDTVEDSDLSDHTGIYIGKSKFIHASSSAGKVIISSLASGYYKRQFSWGRRILN